MNPNLKVIVFFGSWWFLSRVFGLDDDQSVLLLIGMGVVAYLTSSKKELEDTNQQLEAENEELKEQVKKNDVAAGRRFNLPL